MAWIRVGDLLVADDASTAAIVNNTSSLTRAALDALYGQPDIPNATINGRGIIELATTSETLAGLDGGRAVTPQTLRAAVNEWRPQNPKVWVGLATINVSGTAGASTSITFPAGRFTSAPHVQLTLAQSQAVTMNAYYSGSTASGISVVGVYNTTGAAYTGSVTVSVLAVQL